MDAMIGEGTFMKSFIWDLGFGMCKCDCLFVIIIILRTQMKLNCNFTMQWNHEFKTKMRVC